MAERSATRLRLIPAAQGHLLLVPRFVCVDRPRRGAAHLLDALANARDSIAVTRESEHPRRRRRRADRLRRRVHRAPLEQGLLLLEAELLARLDQVQALLEERGERTSGGDEDGAADEVDAFQPGKRLLEGARRHRGGARAAGRRRRRRRCGRCGARRLCRARLGRGRRRLGRRRQVAAGGEGRGDHPRHDGRGRRRELSFTATTVKFGVGEHAPTEAEAAAAAAAVAARREVTLVQRLEAAGLYVYAAGWRSVEMRGAGGYGRPGASIQ